MANPQKEYGYVGIANELYEAIYMHYDFTKRQLKVISTIIRFTYGWNRKECTLSLREIERETGISYRHICPTITELVKQGVIIVSEEINGARKYKINKNYEEWCVTKTATGCYQNGNTSCYQNGNAGVTETVTHTIKRQLKTYKNSVEFNSLVSMFPQKKQIGLNFVKEEMAAEIVENIEKVRAATEAYLADVSDEKYMMTAGRFFGGDWKAWAEETETRTKKKGRFE